MSCIASGGITEGSPGSPLRRSQGCVDGWPRPRRGRSPRCAPPGVVCEGWITTGGVAAIILRPVKIDTSASVAAFARMRASQSAFWRMRLHRRLNSHREQYNHRLPAWTTAGVHAGPQAASTATEHCLTSVRLHHRPNRLEAPSQPHQYESTYVNSLPCCSDLSCALNTR